MRLLSVILAVCVAIPTCASARSYHIAYWKLLTPTGRAFECRLVESRRDLEASLVDAGWGGGIPAIDWSKDCAIVIAPNSHKKGWTEAFYSLEWTGQRFELKRGQVETYESFNAAETIVVSFPHYVHASNTLVCIDQGNASSTSKEVHKVDTYLENRERDGSRHF